MFELIKTEKNKRFYKLDQPIKYIEYDPYIAKEVWEREKKYNNKYNQETIPDFIEYIVISDGIAIKKERAGKIEERVAFIGYKCEKTNEIICTYEYVENRFDTYYDISQRPYCYVAWLDDDDKILKRIIEFDKLRKEWNDLTKDELIDKYKNSDDKYDFGKYVYEERQKEIIMEFIKDFDFKILKYANEYVLRDKKFMIELIKINFDVMKYISYYNFGWRIK